MMMQANMALAQKTMKKPKESHRSGQERMKATA
jgi:hypothetical protein